MNFSAKLVTFSFLFQDERKDVKEREEKKEREDKPEKRRKIKSKDHKLKKKKDKLPFGSKVSEI